MIELSIGARKVVVFTELYRVMEILRESCNAAAAEEQLAGDVIFSLLKMPDPRPREGLLPKGQRFCEETFGGKYGGETRELEQLNGVFGQKERDVFSKYTDFIQGQFEEYGLDLDNFSEGDIDGKCTLVLLLMQRLVFLMLSSNAEHTTHNEIIKQAYIRFTDSLKSEGILECEKMSYNAVVGRSDFARRLTINKFDWNTRLANIIRVKRTLDANKDMVQRGQNLVYRHMIALQQVALAILAPPGVLVGTKACRFNRDQIVRNLQIVERRFLVEQQPKMLKSQSRESMSRQFSHLALLIPELTDYSNDANRRFSQALAIIEAVAATNEQEKYHLLLRVYRLIDLCVNYDDALAAIDTINRVSGWMAYISGSLSLSQFSSQIKSSLCGIQDFIREILSADAANCLDSSTKNLLDKVIGISSAESTKIDIFDLSVKLVEDEDTHQQVMQEVGGALTVLRKCELKLGCTMLLSNKLIAMIGDVSTSSPPIESKSLSESEGYHVACQEFEPVVNLVKGKPAAALCGRKKQDDSTSHEAKPNGVSGIPETLESVSALFRFFEIPGDGQCLFSAMACVLNNSDSQGMASADEGARHDAGSLRAEIVAYLESKLALDRLTPEVFDELEHYAGELSSYHDEVAIQTDGRQPLKIKITGVSIDNHEALEARLQQIISAKMSSLAPDESQRYRSAYIKIKKYVQLIRQSGCWGGSIETSIFGKLYQRPVYVVYKHSSGMLMQSDDYTLPYGTPNAVPDPSKSLFLAYNGVNHYDALVPVSDESASQAIEILTQRTAQIASLSPNHLQAAIDDLCQIVRGKMVDLRGDIEVAKTSYRQRYNFTPVPSYKSRMLLEHGLARASCGYFSKKNGDLDSQKEFDFRKNCYRDSREPSAVDSEIKFFGFAKLLRDHSLEHTKIGSEKIVEIKFLQPLCQIFDELLFSGNSKNNDGYDLSRADLLAYYMYVDSLLIHTRELVSKYDASEFSLTGKMTVIDEIKAVLAAGNQYWLQRDSERRTMKENTRWLLDFIFCKPSLSANRRECSSVLYFGIFQLLFKSLIQSSPADAIRQEFEALINTFNANIRRGVIGFDRLRTAVIANGLKDREAKARYRSRFSRFFMIQSDKERSHSNASSLGTQLVVK